MRLITAFAALSLASLSANSLAQPAREFSGVLTQQQSRATFSFDLSEGQIVTLSTSSETGLDTVLSLSGPNGRQIAENDDAEPGDLSSRIVLRAPASGRYTATVTGYGGATGPFELNVSDQVEVGLSDEAQVISQEVVSLSGRQTEARFPLDLGPDTPFVATTIALTEGLDTVLNLIGPDGEVVATNDDRGDGTLNSQIAFIPAAAGRFTLVATSFSGGDTGDMVLSLALDPNADAPFNFDSIARTPLVQLEGSLSDDQPEMDYVFELAAGQTLMAMAETIGGELDTIVRIEGPDGHPVALNDDRGDGSLNSAAAYTATQAGAYTVQVTRYGTTTGDFALEVSHVDASVVDTLQSVLERQIVLSGPEEIIETADFRLRYTLEGDDATTHAFAQLTADTLQRAYETQMALGWAAPIRDEDGRYRAYVADAEDAMGYMSPVQMMFDNPNTLDRREETVSRGLLVIDNELSDGREEAVEALMHATVVHEFNHLVQQGYDSQEGLNWLYESTASWIEINTAGEDEDASRYAATDYETPELCWTTNEPGRDYGQWTLLQSLADTHGDRFIVRLWENTITHDGMDTMAFSLGEVGDTIPAALQRWRIQNFARAYDRASVFRSAVAQGGSIKREGAYTAGRSVEQLGAAYLQIRARGAQSYTVDSDAGLELVGLGFRDGQVEVIPLGRGGVMDSTGYEYAALMVFNPAVPDTPGDCMPQDYVINVSAASAPAAPVTARIPAPHFAQPGQ